MRLIRAIMMLGTLLLATSATAQPEPEGFDPSDFGKIIILPRQSESSFVLEQAFGAYNNEPIVEYGENSPVVQLARPIGRLDMLFEDGTTGFCTAFLVDDQHLLTNHHCVPGMTRPADGSVSGLQAAQFVAGYLHSGRSDGANRYTVSLQIVETNRELDYSVLRVFGDPASQYGTLELVAEDPQDAEFLWVIGHPKGQVQHISREGCAAATPAISGEGKLMHSCDTLGGNSGSPVIRLSDKRVVGLHHAGDSLSGFNMAIPMAQILAQSAILKAAVPRQPGAPPAAAPSVPAAPAAQPKAEAGGASEMGALCTLLWQEAQNHGCTGYEAYLATCGEHVFAPLAKRYAARNCAAPQGAQTPVTTTVVRVNPNGLGDAKTISNAVAMAPIGARIEVHPGIYDEPLKIDKPVHIMGRGPVDQIVVRAFDSNVLRWTATSGSVSGLTLLQTGATDPDKGFYGIHIASGSVTLENNVISSQSYAALAIRTDDSAIVRGNVVRDSASGGIFVLNGAKALIEGNEIQGNARAGLEIKNGGAPIVRGNIFKDGGGSGIFVNAGGGGLIEGNTIFNNRLSGIQVKAAQDIVIRDNTLRQGQQSGVLVSEGATPRIEGNRIWGNALSGIEIKTGAVPEIFENQIHDGGQSGIYIHSEAGGVIESNQIYGQGFHAISAKENSNPIVRGNRMYGNAGHAVRLRLGAGGVFENNDMRDSPAGAFLIEENAGEVLRRGNAE